MKDRKFRRIWGKPWDWYYLLNLERCKIREMMNYINKTQRFVGWEIVVRDMRTSIKLIDIVLEERESAVGKYSVDIYGKEEGTDRKVVIENQLEDSDHDHL